MLLGMDKLGDHGQPAGDAQHHREIDEEVRRAPSTTSRRDPRTPAAAPGTASAGRGRECRRFGHGIESPHELAGDDELAERRAHQGERRHAFRTALLDRMVSTITPRMMKTSGTQIGTRSMSAATIHSVSSMMRSPAMSNKRAEQARLVALARDVAVEPVRHEDEDDQKESRERPGRQAADRTATRRAAATTAGSA